MNYTSLAYYAMVIVLLVTYYALPKKIRWTALLAGSIYFYANVIDQKNQAAILLFSVLWCYLAGIALQRLKGSSRKQLKRFTLAIGIAMSILPLLLGRAGNFLENAMGETKTAWIMPVGLSFYALQMAAYLADIYKGKINAQTNPFKFGLFITFFPQIIQGPIPRYESLQESLFEGNRYDSKNIMGGIQLIIWGFFLKYMIADKSAVIVNQVFDNHDAYAGLYIWIAGILYSIQLYADFLSCTTISQGVAQMFGIRLEDNFRRPYFATSMKEFWQRWHISLSSWLRDYVYIPLGGNRRGPFRKWANIVITFAVSGLWHGGSGKFIAWGMLHALYQAAEEVIGKIVRKNNTGKEKPKNKTITLYIRQLTTFMLATFTWIIFRADTLKTAMEMIRTMVTEWNPWILTDDSLLRMGLHWKEWCVLFLSIMTLHMVSKAQEKGIIIREWFEKQSMAIRWGIYLVAIWAIWVCGTYGFGFDTIHFIYQGF